jgi:hypothetical protein
VNEQANIWRSISGGAMAQALTTFRNGYTASVSSPGTATLKIAGCGPPRPNGTFADGDMLFSSATMIETVECES